MSSAPEPLFQMATRAGIYFSAESQEMNQPSPLLRKLVLKLFLYPLPPRFPGTREAMPRVRTGVKGQDLIQQHPHHPLFPATLGNQMKPLLPPATHSASGPQGLGTGDVPQVPQHRYVAHPLGRAVTASPLPGLAQGPHTLSCPGRLCRTASRGWPPRGSGRFARCRARTNPYCTDD